MIDRITAIKELARTRRCSHIFVSDPVDVEYISGFKSTNAYLLISPRRHLLFTDFRYRTAAQRFCRGRTWRFVESGENGFTAIARCIAPGSRVGVQSDSMTVDQFDCMRKLCRKASFIKLGPAIAHISAVKLPHEIAAMRRAARIGDRALAVFLRRLRPGMSERDASRLLEELCRKFGSEEPAFPTIVLFGRRTALVHGQPSDRALKRGDLILCDFGCTVNGFRSDMTRTMVMGGATQRQRKMYEIVFQAQRQARLSVCSGKRAAGIDACAREFITQAGLGGAFGHATGHGVGRRIHEKPRIARRDKTILREHMVVTIEPGVYLPSWGGIRIEDMVVVGKNGARCLTNFPRRLVEIR